MTVKEDRYFNGTVIQKEQDAKTAEQYSTTVASSNLVKVIPDSNGLLQSEPFAELCGDCTSCTFYKSAHSNFVIGGDCTKYHEECGPGFTCSAYVGPYAGIVAESILTAVEDAVKSFSRALNSEEQKMEKSNAQLLNEYLDTLLKYWNGEIDEADFTPISIPTEVDSEMQKDSFY